MSDDYRRPQEVPPPPSGLEPEVPTSVRARPRRRNKCAKSYLAANPVTACAMLRDLMKPKE